MNSEWIMEFLHMLGNLSMFNLLEHISLSFLGIHIEVQSPGCSEMDRDSQKPLLWHECHFLGYGTGAHSYYLNVFLLFKPQSIFPSLYLYLNKVSSSIVASSMQLMNFLHR